MPRASDILVEIPDPDLPKLAAFYKKCLTVAPHIVSLIHTGIAWKRTENYRHSFTFFSVEKKWEEDGTVIILQTNSCYNISVFTLDETNVNLYRGLTETQRLDYSTENAVFFCVHEKHVPTIRRVIDHLQLTATESAYSMLTLPPDLGHYDSIKPEETYFKPLDLESLGQINSVWSCKFKNSEKYLKSLIELNGGFGLFLKRTDQMVAWILRYTLGHVGLLQTDEEWKRKGFGTSVAKVLIGEIAKDGHWPFATISHKNSASVHLFEKLGFRKIGDCVYFTFKD